MRKYLVGNLWNIILCGLMAAALITVFAQCFYIPDSVADSYPLALLVSLIIIFLSYLAWYRRFGIVLFFILLAVAAAAFFGWLRMNGIDIVDTQDSQTAVYIYCFAAVIMPLLTFFLARGRIGICVLFVIGICLFGLADYLAYEIKTVYCACFIVSALVLFALQLYRVRALKGSSFSPRFGKLGMSALVVGVISLALSAAVYLAVVVPLSPPTAEMEFIVVFLKWDRTEKVGISNNVFMFNENLRSATFNQGSETSHNKKTQEEQEEEEDNANMRQDKKTQEEALGEKSGGGSGEEAFYSAVSYTKSLLKSLLPLIIILIVAVIVFIPLLKRYLWQRRLKIACSLSPQERIIMLCRYYMVRFRRLGFSRRSCLTELEYAEALEGRLEPYTRGTLSIKRMMEIYTEARYGGLAPDAEEDGMVQGFYPVFVKNYRKQNGNFRYLLNYFKF